MNNNTPDNSFFKTFLHQCNDLVVITDNQARIVYVNPAFEKHTGYPFKEIKGKNISIVKSGAHNLTFYRNLWKKLKEGRPQSCVFINKKRNGELYYENKTITPIKNKQRQIEYYLSTSKDVTGELKLQREVIKQKNFIHSVVQNTDALIVGFDTNANITLFNTACEKLTGYTFSQVKGKSILSLLVPSEEKRRVSSSINKIIRQKDKFLKNEYTLITKNGKRILVSWSHTLIKDEKGLPQVILSTGIDVTRERDNEKKLIQLNLSLDQKVRNKTKKLSDLNAAILSQNKFVRKINRELPALVYLIDLQNKTIRLFNNKINRKISVPENKDEDIPIDRFLKYINNKADTDYSGIFLSAPVENMEIPFKVNGKNYWFQNRSIIFEKNQKGKSVKILGFISDITKTKFIQNKLEESQKIARLGTWEWDIDNDNLYWSDEVYRIFEIDPAEFKPSYPKFLGAIHSEDRSSVIEAVNRSLINKTSYEVVHRLKEKNNKIKFVREKGYTQYSETGQPLRMIGTIQDITEEKQLKDNLKSAYVTLQNSLNAIITTDLKGLVLFANNAAVKMWGFSDYQEMINERSLLNNYWPARHHDQIKEIRELALENGYYFSESPFTSVKVDGSEILVKFNLSVIRAGDKKPNALTWCFFDVTEQIRAERKVKEYDTKINLLLGNIDEVVFGLDAEYGSYTAGKVFYLSARSLDLMGFTLDDLKSNQDLWISLIHPDDLENYCQSNLKCISARSSVTRTYRMRHRETNIYRWFEEKITPYYDEQNELRSFYGSARDVTERIESEIKLKENEMKYRSIFENALVGIFRTNTNTQKAVDANDVCIKLFGYDSKEDFLNNFTASNHWMEPSERIELFSNLTVNTSVMNKKMRFKRKDGTMFWGDASAKVLSSEGILEGVVVDVTKNHEFEAQLKRNLLEKEVLLKEVHHRVKNNLQIISSLLKLQLNKLQNPELKQALVESYERIHAIALIHEKLYLSDDVSTINFSEYLVSLTKSMLPLHREKKINLIFNATPFHTNISIAIPLGLICYEIISNAFKHAFKAQREYELSIHVAKLNGSTEIVIRDSGEGFETEILDSTNTLGWKLINNLAKQARADVEIKSTPTAGTLLKIVL